MLGVFRTMAKGISLGIGASALCGGVISIGIVGVGCLTQIRETCLLSKELRHPLSEQGKKVYISEAKAITQLSAYVSIGAVLWHMVCGSEHCLADCSRLLMEISEIRDSQKSKATSPIQAGVKRVVNLAQKTTFDSVFARGVFGLRTSVGLIALVAGSTAVNLLGQEMLGKHVRPQE